MPVVSIASVTAPGAAGCSGAMAVMIRSIQRVFTIALAWTIRLRWMRRA